MTAAKTTKRTSMAAIFAKCDTVLHSKRIPAAVTAFTSFLRRPLEIVLRLGPCPKRCVSPSKSHSGCQHCRTYRSASIETQAAEFYSTGKVNSIKSETEEASERYLAQRFPHQSVQAARFLRTRPLTCPGLVLLHAEYGIAVDRRPNHYQFICRIRSSDCRQMAAKLTKSMASFRFRCVFPVG